MKLPWFIFRDYHTEFLNRESVVLLSLPYHGLFKFVFVFFNYYYQKFLLKWNGLQGQRVCCISVPLLLCKYLFTSLDSIASVAIFQTLCVSFLICLHADAQVWSSVFS